MEKIIKGVIEFQQRKFHDKKNLFAELANQQKPEILFITCSDSRIDPNLITQSEPGDLFICRNAGNVVPPHMRNTGGVTASIEYAVGVLGIKQIIVCGHTDSGAVIGALTPDGLESLPHVQDWIYHIKAAVDCVKAKYGQATMDELLEVTEQNVLLQLQHLRTHPAVLSGITNNQISLHGWVYHIETGRVTCHDPEKDKFVSIEERYAELLSPGKLGA